MGDDEALGSETLAPNREYGQSHHTRSSGRSDTSVSEILPKWVPDKEQKNCFACGRSFNFILFRRHHCRACGKIFCGACSTQCIELPRFGLDTPERVCDGCFLVESNLNPDAKTQKVPKSIKNEIARKIMFRYNGEKDEEADRTLRERSVSISSSYGIFNVTPLLSTVAALEGKEYDEVNLRQGSPMPKSTKRHPTLKPPHLNIAMVLVGSRGDVQPFIAFGLGLKEDGHTVRICTHECFREFVTSHGLDFRPIAGDPRKLMALMVEHGMFSFGFVRDGLKYQRTWIRELLDTSWAACIDGVDSAGRAYTPDALICNPVSFVGPHIAEKLCIPLHMAFTMPWSRTVSFPQPFAATTDSTVKDSKFNFLSYGALERMTWLCARDLINEWRVHTLCLPPIRTTNMSGHRLLHDLQVPFIYSYSPHLLPKPRDWGEHIDVVGFWFLDGTQNYTPPSDVASFLEAGDPPVYIGFGSIVVPDPDALTKVILEGVKLSGRRVIIQKGWAGMEVEEVPDNVLFMGPAPHDWLFAQCSAVMHHGGAGTVSAGLRLGKPTFVVPFFGDQFFWGSTVSKMGLGPPPIPYQDLTPEKVSESILAMLTPEAQKAADMLGMKIRSEDGISAAKEAFYSKLPVELMSCDINSNHVAKCYCPTCNIKTCYVCDWHIHSHPDNKEHRRIIFRYRDWLKNRSTFHPVVNGLVDSVQHLGRKISKTIRKDDYDQKRVVRDGGTAGDTISIKPGLEGIVFRPIRPPQKKNQRAAPTAPALSVDVEEREMVLKRFEEIRR